MAKAVKIEVGSGDGKDPKAKVDALVSGREYPFDASFTNALKKRPLVVSSAKFGGVVPAGETVTFTINSYEQAWGIVMDVAGMAEAMKKELLGTLTVAASTATSPQVEAK